VGGGCLEVLEVLTFGCLTLVGLIEHSSFHREGRSEALNCEARIVVGDDLVGACVVACEVTLMGHVHQICGRNDFVWGIVSMLGIGFNTEQVSKMNR
jgi:hypothetical protein